MVVEVLLAECSCGRFPLYLPFFAVRNENAGPVKRSQGVLGEIAPSVILTILLLDILEVGGMVDNVQAEERNGHLVSRSISLVQGVPCLATSSTVGPKLLYIAFQ